MRTLQKLRARVVDALDRLIDGEPAPLYLVSPGIDSAAVVVTDGTGVWGLAFGVTSLAPIMLCEWDGTTGLIALRQGDDEWLVGMVGAPVVEEFLTRGLSEMGFKSVSSVPTLPMGTIH